MKRTLTASAIALSALAGTTVLGDVTQNEPEQTAVGAFENATDSMLFSVSGALEHREQSASQSTNGAGQVNLGKMLFEDKDLYRSYVFGTTAFDTDDRLRFSLSAASFLPYVDGELQLSYRLLYGDLRDRLNAIDYSEGIDEHGLALTYRYYLNSFVKEAGASWLYTNIDGLETDSRTWSVDTSDYISTYRSAVGFGDLKSNTVFFSTALGSENLSGPIDGYRFDIEAGYEAVERDPFMNLPGTEEDGLFGSLAFTLDSGLGRWKNEYRDSPASNSLYTGWKYGPAEIFYRDTNYTGGSDEQLVGISFTFNLFDNKKPSLFRSSTAGYADVHEMSHFNELSSNEFYAKPKLQIDTELVSRIEKPKPKPAPVITSEEPEVPVESNASQETIEPEESVEPICGNATCEEGENAETCSEDCEVVTPEPVCGNAVCEESEDDETCPADCGSVIPEGPVCGDNICDDGEDCLLDCGGTLPVCGDNLCDWEAGEDEESCSADCAF